MVFLFVCLLSLSVFLFLSLVKFSPGLLKVLQIGDVGVPSIFCENHWLINDCFGPIEGHNLDRWGKLN